MGRSKNNQNKKNSSEILIDTSGIKKIRAAKAVLCMALAAAFAVTALGGCSSDTEGVPENNESAEAEISGVSMVEDATADKEETAQEEEETAKAEDAADETAVMYSLYYEKLAELEAEYGKASVKAECGAYESYTLEEAGYYTIRSYEGLCCAKLVDFDADGTEELFVVFSAPITVAEYTLYGEIYEMECDYTVEVWAYKNGAIECVYHNKPSYWASYEDASYYANIIFTENGCYIAEGESGEGGAGFEYYAYDGVSFYVVQYNGYLLSETYGYDTREQEEEYLEWAESIDIVSEYCFFAYEWAAVGEVDDSLYDDPDPADCEDTIKYLEEYSGAGTLAQDSPEETVKQPAAG